MEGKEELVITFRPKQPASSASERFPYVGEVKQSTHPVPPVGDNSGTDGGGTIPQEIGEQPPSETDHPDPGNQVPTVSVVSVPKSKWESDEEDSEKHIVLVPETNPKPEVPVVKPAVKKRDPSLHMGQIVKDIRYSVQCKAKVQELIGEGKPQEEEKDENLSDESEKKKVKGSKKKKKDREKRSRSTERKKSKRRDKDSKRDRRSRSDSRDRSRSDSRDRKRRSRSDSRDRGRRGSRDRRRSRSGSRDRDRYRAFQRGRPFMRGRGRGRGRGLYYDNRYYDRDKRYDSRDKRYDSRRRSRSRSRSRDRRRSRRDRYSSSRSRSRSSSYSDSSYSRSSSGSSYSSWSSSDESRSRSRERDIKKKGKKEKSVGKKIGVNEKKKDAKSVAKVDEKLKVTQKEPTPEEAVEKEYDIFSGEHVAKQQVDASKEAKAPVKSTFASVGGLSDPLGLKQLTKPLAQKSKVYSGPIYDMPQMKVTATTEPAVKPSAVPLAAAKPLKSILKKKKPQEEVADNQAKPETGPVSTPSEGADLPNLPGILDNAGLVQLSSLLGQLVPQSNTELSQSVATLVAALSTQQQHQVLQQQQAQQQVFQQQEQLLQQQVQQQTLHQQHQGSFGVFGGQGSNAIPGLGNEANFGTRQNPLSFLSGNPSANIPGLDMGNVDPSAHHPTHGGGGISTFSVTGLGGLSSATVASGLPTSLPGLTDAPASSYQPTAPQSNLNLSSILQQSGLKMTPELSAALSGVQKHQQQQHTTNVANPGLHNQSANFQSSSYQSSANVPFMSDTMVGQSSAVEEEDQFLYGEASHGNQEQVQPSQTWQMQQAAYQNQESVSLQTHTQSVPQEEYIPESHLPAAQAKSVDSNQIQKILSAIGFDFDMAKKVAQEKEKTRTQQQPQREQSKPTDRESIQNYLKAQRAESDQKPRSQVPDSGNSGGFDASGSSVAPEYKLEGLNQTASFLVTGLQMPEETSTEATSKPGKKKKKKDKSEKKKAKKEKQKEKQGKGAESLDKSKKGASADKQTNKQESGHSKSGSKSLMTEPVSDDELEQHDQTQKQKQYSDIANIKIQVAQKPSSSDSESNRRIVLLPQDQGKSSWHEEDQAYGPTVPTSREQTGGAWQTQQYQEDDYYKRKEWEAMERNRIKEELQNEFMRRENAEKEKRRKEMLKKEQEWLMREVALKTMEEKIRREEEKLLREREQRRREDQRRLESERLKENERRYRLKKEKEEIQKRMVVLERELSSLKKQQGDLMRRKQHQKDGHKDPQLLKNNELQEEISEEIIRLRKMYASVGDRFQDKEDDRGRRELVDGREGHYKTRPSDTSARDRSSERSSTRDKSTERSSTRDRSAERSSAKQTSGKEPSRDTSEKDRSKDRPDHHSRHEKRSSIDENQESKARFKFTYFDNGDHWCRPCQKTLRNLNELFMHLHSKKHMKHVDPMDRPWLPSDIKQEKSEDESRLRAPIKGGEFMMPVNGFYCRLCHVFLGDGVCGSEHMKDPYHNMTYQKLLEENKQYEKQLDLEKAALGSGTQSDTSKADQDEEKKGTKRKAEQEAEGEEKLGKQVKQETTDVKVSEEKQPGGFGKFEFEKPKEESASPQAAAAPAPAIELRKDSGQKASEAAAAAKKEQQQQQQQKLSIKLGSKRLIPSALFRKTNQPTFTAGEAATTATSSTNATPSGAAPASGRSMRSSTATQRPLPMIGKRPTRRSKEESKDVKEPPSPDPAAGIDLNKLQSSLEIFLQGEGGKALPIIGDDDKEKEGKEEKEDGEEKKKEEKEMVEDTGKEEEFVLTASDIANAFKGDSSVSEGMVLQVIDTYESDEDVEMPEVPGSEVTNEDSSMPTPIPPPPADDTGMPAPPAE